MINLYTWSTPNGRKISIALEEMGLPYKVTPVDLGAGDQNTPEYRKISPHSAIPAIVDEDTGLALAESAAILMYLAEKSGKLLPSDSTSKWETVQWLLWQASGQGPSLGQAHHFLKFNPGKSSYAEERFRTQAHRIYTQLENRLKDREFIAGDQLTITDIAVWPWTSRFEYHQVDLTEYPNVCKWYLALAQREGFVRGYKIPDSSLDIPMPGKN